GCFLRSHCFDGLLCMWYCAHNVFIQNAHAARGDRTGGQFFETRDAEFANNENIERGTEAFRNFVGNRHAAPRQAENDHVVTIGIFYELFCQQPPCFVSICKGSFHAAERPAFKLPKRAREITTACAEGNYASLFPFHHRQCRWPPEP